MRQEQIYNRSPRLVANQSVRKRLSRGLVVDFGHERLDYRLSRFSDGLVQRIFNLNVGIVVPCSYNPMLTSCALREFMSTMHCRYRHARFLCALAARIITRVSCSGFCELSNGRARPCTLGTRIVSNLGGSLVLFWTSSPVLSTSSRLLKQGRRLPVTLTLDYMLIDIEMRMRRVP